MSTVRPHVPEEELHAFHDGELSSAQRAEIAEHLLGCLLCRALDGEVGEVRSRTSVLLLRAVPRTRRQPAAARRRSFATWSGPIAAGLVALVGGSAWIALQPAAAGTPRLATAFVAPGIFADVQAAAGTRIDPMQRSLSLAAQTRMSPRVVAPSMAPVAHGPFDAQPADDVDPAGGAEWEPVSVEAAVEANHGAIARVDGLPVSRVQVRRSTAGERPTVLVRQQTAEGRSVWVVEGPVEERSSLSKMFEASGLTMSIPQRTRPDIVGSEANPTRTVRMIAVAGYLPVDSLDALTGKLKRN